MLPDPIFIFGFPFYPFGIIAALSIFIGYRETEIQMRKLNLPLELLPNLALFVMGFAFLGARLLFVLTHINDYALSPLNVLKFWEGGLVFQGGLLGGLFGGFLFCRIKKVSFAQFSDPVAFGIALGLALSRLGCFAAGCCYGKPSNLPWAIAFHHPNTLATPLHVPLHPTQVYFFLFGIAVYFVLRSFASTKTFPGEILLLYLILNSAGRLYLEQFRADSTFNNYLIALLLLSVSSFLYLQLKIKGRKLMKVPVLRVTAFIMVAYFIAACGIIKTQKIARGLDIETNDVNSIVKGQTTEKEIIKLFGPPTKVRDVQDGKEFFYEYTKTGGPQWNLVVSLGGNSVTKTLIVWLDKNGVVTDYAYKRS